MFEQRKRETKDSTHLENSCCGFSFEREAREETIIDLDNWMLKTDRSTHRPMKINVSLNQGKKEERVIWKLCCLKKERNMEKYVKRGKEEGERQILSARLIEKHAEAGGRGKEDYDIGEKQNNNGDSYFNQPRLSLPVITQQEIKREELPGKVISAYLNYVNIVKIPPSSITKPSIVNTQPEPEQLPVSHHIATIKPQMPTAATTPSQQLESQDTSPAIIASLEQYQLEEENRKLYEELTCEKELHLQLLAFNALQRENYHSSLEKLTLRQRYLEMRQKERKEELEELRTLFGEQ